MLNLRITLTHQDEVLYEDSIDINERNFNNLDTYADASISNAKMSAMSFTYKNRPDIWFNNTPKVEHMQALKVFPIYRIKYNMYARG
jgi:hypothetical protein